jgi:hypothetical protein
VLRIFLNVTLLATNRRNRMIIRCATNERKSNTMCEKAGVLRLCGNVASRVKNHE